jgi:hypothetical protein
MTTMLVPLFSGFAGRDPSINVMFKWWNNGSRQLVFFRGDSWEFRRWNPSLFDFGCVYQAKSGHAIIVAGMIGT